MSVELVNIADLVLQGHDVCWSCKLTRLLVKENKPMAADRPVEEEEFMQENPEEDVMTLMGLPTSFDGGNKRRKRPERDTLWNFSDTEDEAIVPELVPSTWTEYWTEWGNYICSVTWLEKFGDFMNPDNKAAIELQRETLASQPRTMTGDYGNLTDSQLKQEITEETNWEDLWAAHCDEVYNIHCERFQAQCSCEKGILVDNNDCGPLADPPQSKEELITNETKLDEGGSGSEPEELPFGNEEKVGVVGNEGLRETEKPIKRTAASRRQQKAVKFVNENGFVFGNKKLKLYGEAQWPTDGSVRNRSKTISAFRQHWIPQVNEIDDGEEENVQQETSLACDATVDMSDVLQDGNFNEDETCSTHLNSLALTSQEITFDLSESEREALVGDYKRVSHNKKMRKYYNQRYRLFSKFDDGIVMDNESWFSVTPERIAEHIAARCRCDIIVDGFCGSGGNAIQFAKTCELVIAVDLDPVKIRCALHNARLYGVEDRIQFICGNYFHVMAALTIRPDVIFLSPPWGGPKYLNAEVFDVDDMMEPKGFAIFEAAKNLSDNLVLFVPRNSSVAQLASLAGPQGKMEVEQNFLNGRIKTVTAYYGPKFL